jgi:hypothetical protein
MPAHSVTPQQVLEELRNLEPSRWFEVLDFISFLKERGSREHAEPGPRELTARTLSQSEIVGMWENREDIGNSLDFARRLRHQAEHRWRSSDNTKHYAVVANLQTIQPYVR